MAEERRQVREGRLERQRPSLRESARYELEGSPARRRLTPRLFLRADEWNEKETHQCKDSQRSELAYQQEPTGVELLT
jgi:hypothetical protein